jgi:hypothetical protein
MKEEVNVDRPRMAQVMSKKSEVRDFGISAQKLARIWNCGLTSARRMLDQTTQKAVCDYKVATMTQRFKASNCQLSFWHLKVDLFTTRCFLRLQGNTCAEVYVVDNGWF